MDENNQYANAMTKPLPIGCIKKEQHTRNIRELSLLLSGMSHEDEIGHFFVVDLEFDGKRATEKKTIFNDIYTPLFEKKKILAVRHRSVYQLFDAIRLRDNFVFNNYKCTAKTHSTMDKKYLIPVYAENLKLLIECCCWTVTKFHQHFTFRQEMFKKDFVISNQVARENAKIPMEKKFYKLINSADFGHDCRNKFNNCYFAPVIDEIEEMSYVRKHHSIYEPDISHFFSTDNLKIQINEDFDNKIPKLDINDDFYESRKNSLEIERTKQLDALKSVKKSKQKNYKRDTFKEVDQLVEDLEKCANTKTIHESHPCRTASIKAIAVKKF